MAPHAAVLPEPAAGMLAVLPGSVAESAAAAPESAVEAAVLPEPKAEAVAQLPKSTPVAAAVLPESVTEAATVQTAPEELRVSCTQESKVHCAHGRVGASADRTSA